MQSFFLWFALQCFFPIWDSLDFAGLSILNRTRETAAYTITVTDAGGTSSQTGRVTLRTNNQRAFLLSELSGISNLPVSGWVRIDSTDTACSAYFTGGTATLLAGTEGTGLLSRSILLPRVQVDDTGFIDVEPTETFAQFVNPSNVQVNVSLQLFSMNGTAQARTNFTVPARGSRTPPRCPGCAREAWRRPGGSTATSCSSTPPAGCRSISRCSRSCARYVPQSPCMRRCWSSTP